MGTYWIGRSVALRGLYGPTSSSLLFMQKRCKVIRMYFSTFQNKIPQNNHYLKNVASIVQGFSCKYTVISFKKIVSCVEDLTCYSRNGEQSGNRIQLLSHPKVGDSGKIHSCILGLVLNDLVRIFHRRFLGICESYVDALQYNHEKSSNNDIVTPQSISLMLNNYVKVSQLLCRLLVFNHAASDEGLPSVNICGTTFCRIIESLCKIILNYLMLEGSSAPNRRISNTPTGPSSLDANVLALESFEVYKNICGHTYQSRALLASVNPIDIVTFRELALDIAAYLPCSGSVLSDMENLAVSSFSLRDSANAARYDMMNINNYNEQDISLICSCLSKGKISCRPFFVAVMERMHAEYSKLLSGNHGSNESMLIPNASGQCLSLLFNSMHHLNIEVPRSFFISVSSYILLLQRSSEDDPKQVLLSKPQAAKILKKFQLQHWSVLVNAFQKLKAPVESLRVLFTVFCAGVLSKVTWTQLRFADFSNLLMAVNGFGKYNFEVSTKMTEAVCDSMIIRSPQSVGSTDLLYLQDNSYGYDYYAYSLPSDISSIARGKRSIHFLQERLLDEQTHSMLLVWLARSRFQHITWITLLMEFLVKEITASLSLSSRNHSRGLSGTSLHYNIARAADIQYLTVQGLVSIFLSIAKLDFPVFIYNDARVQCLNKHQTRNPFFSTGFQHRPRQSLIQGKHIDYFLAKISITKVCFISLRSHKTEAAVNTEFRDNTDFNDCEVSLLHNQRILNCCFAAAYLVSANTFWYDYMWNNDVLTKLAKNTQSGTTPILGGSTSYVGNTHDGISRYLLYQLCACVLHILYEQPGGLINLSSKTLRNLAHIFNIVGNLEASTSVGSTYRRHAHKQHPLGFAKNEPEVSSLLHREISGYVRNLVASRRRDSSGNMQTNFMVVDEATAMPYTIDIVIMALAH